MSIKVNNLFKLMLVALASLSVLWFAGCSDDDSNPLVTEEGDYFFDDDIAPGDTVTLTADTEWVLSGFVFVEEGAVLNIEAGTVIKGRPGQGVNASALIICMGGKINANGTADNPIIMTAEADDVDDPDDIPTNAKGLWGGLIILGKATNNNPGGTGQVEGIPSDEPRGEYGGNNDADNSGTLRYVSIRHGGSEIGAANEINGLTLGSVGSGTTIEYIEVFSNLDDGVEWFGGTVNCKNMVVAFCGDDCYDYDEGFRGKGQFWFSIQASDEGNRAGEHDGATEDESATPYAHPVISNVTYIGSGATSANADNDHTFKIRDNAGGEYHNSIFYDFNGDGVDVEDLADSVSTQDSRKMLEDGLIVFENNVWYSFGDGNDAAGVWPQDYVRTYMNNTGTNVIQEPQLANIARTATGALDPRPSAAGPAGSGAAIPSGGFFTNVTYKGAFDPNGDNWLTGWTALSEYGFAQ
ncbi:MAG: T9SS C-terminal target domain-containing protein [candidate division Zixibacteria bacterium]|nr:T9SS C-terminal target domain-containing protein [candidate division Zixibacteria bacterium]